MSETEIGVTPIVDLVILSRDVGPLDPDVERGFRAQRGVQLVVHRVAGSVSPDDRGRCDAIARARNEGKLRGASPWLMFLDDDVWLEPACISTLVEELRRRPAYAALAADYLGECRAGEIAGHVSMGATLFRREALDQVCFAWRGGSCECQCCCDDLRRLHWGIDYLSLARARHLPRVESCGNHAACKTIRDDPTVTCMCVTRGRVRMLRRSIQCFLNQTYRRRELVVVYQTDDSATRRFLGGLKEPSVLSVGAPAGSRHPLGSLRNLALRSGTGKYIAQWDDDDWYSPARLEEQVRAIRESGKPGCVLARWTLYDCLTQRAYYSNVRTWEGSIVVERAVVPRYPHVAKREDTPVVEELNRRGQLTMLDRPTLYVYVYHGTNTWDRRHWERILRVSRPLGEAASRRITAILDVEPRRATRFSTFAPSPTCDFQREPLNLPGAQFQAVREKSHVLTARALGSRLVWAPVDGEN